MTRKNLITGEKDWLRKTDKVTKTSH